ncbi:phosphotriesterase-related protein, partial [Thermoproteota archaeon]
DETNDMDYLLGLLEKGVWLGFDGFHLTPGSPEELPWEERAVTTQKLIDVGFGHKIMLSHDWSITAPTFFLPGVDRGNPDGYLFISRKVLPRLREMGVSEDMINQMMVENPRRFFEGS